MKTRKLIVWCFLASLIPAGVYLLASIYIYEPGFPLDDAWIHQTYARNLAVLGEWSFIPGQPSGGSTAPLWSALLAIGYLFMETAYPWAYLLGWLCLAGTAAIAELLLRKYLPDLQTRLPVLGGFLLFEWHLVWAAVSGMETIMLVLGIVVFFCLLLSERVRWGLVGLVVGISVWIRPDGLTLLGPLFFTACLTPDKWSRRVLNLGKAVLLFFVGFIPYLLFNQMITGNFWPNTYYAKQAEYQVLLQTSLALRFFRLAGLPLIGPGVLLLPGFVYVLWVAGKRKHWAGLSAILWWAGYTLLYAIRLPVTYQHGRYLIPAMPVYFCAGFLGMLLLLRGKQRTGRIGFVLKAGWPLALAIVLFLFFSIGAGSYANDVGIIQTEMVQTAKWLGKNTPKNTLVAAHDIGAIGFYGERNLVDLAGLISPDVIPFIRDEMKLAEYLDLRKVDYLVTFPGWYPALVKHGDLLYTTGGNFSPLSGGENMAVYRWKIR